MTYSIVISGRKELVVVKDLVSGKRKAVHDTSPAIVHYRDYRHALIDAPKLQGLSVVNPMAVVELRPGNLDHSDTGETMSLADWITYAKKQPLPAISPRVEVVVLSHGAGELDALLAEQAAEEALALA